MLAKLLDGLMNVRSKQKDCTCPIHDNETLRQVDASLPNGKPIRILQDSYGYHVAIGDIEHCPPAVSEAKAARLLQDALQKARR